MQSSYKNKWLILLDEVNFDGKNYEIKEILIENDKKASLVIDSVEVSEEIILNNLKFKPSDSDLSWEVNVGKISTKTINQESIYFINNAINFFNLLKIKIFNIEYSKKMGFSSVGLIKNYKGQYLLSIPFYYAINDSKNFKIAALLNKTNYGFDLTFNDMSKNFEFNLIYQKHDFQLALKTQTEKLDIDMSFFSDIEIKYFENFIKNEYMYSDNIQYAYLKINPNFTLSLIRNFDKEMIFKAKYSSNIALEKFFYMDFYILNLDIDFSIINFAFEYNIPKKNIDHLGFALSKKRYLNNFLFSYSSENLKVETKEVINNKNIKNLSWSWIGTSITLFPLYKTKDNLISLILDTKIDLKSSVYLLLDLGAWTLNKSLLRYLEHKVPYCPKHGNPFKDDLTFDIKLNLVNKDRTITFIFNPSISRLDINLKTKKIDLISVSLKEKYICCSFHIYKKDFIQQYKISPNGFCAKFLFKFNDNFSVKFLGGYSKNKANPILQYPILQLGCLIKNSSYKLESSIGMDIDGMFKSSFRFTLTGFEEFAEIQEILNDLMIEKEKLKTLNVK